MSDNKSKFNSSGCILNYIKMFEIKVTGPEGLGECMACLIKSPNSIILYNEKLQYSLLNGIY